MLIWGAIYVVHLFWDALLIVATSAVLLYVPIKCLNCVYEFIASFFCSFSVIVSLDIIIIILELRELKTIKHPSLHRIADKLFIQYTY